MARRTVTPEYHPANLSSDQIRRAIPRIERRIQDLEQFDPSQLQERGAPEVRALELSIEQTLEDIFGHQSLEFKRFRSAASFDGGPISMTPDWIGVRGGYQAPDLEFRHYYAESKKRSIAMLKQLVLSLQERLQEGSLEGVKEPAVFDATASESVFVVHGHEEGPREAVGRFLEKIGLRPVILHEMANKGRSLLTKFSEEASDVGFAIVLMTPDDRGGANSGTQSARARQNVIFEMGFFIGKLGASRVASLVHKEVERPSDYDGIVYIPLETDWRLPLCRELIAAGYSIDLNKALR
jgi:predicted nucleotide-binding protein